MATSERRLRAIEGARESNEAIEAARAAGLRYVTDASAGYSRRKRGRSFSYHDVDGSLITNQKTIARIKSLAVPPAWTEVWICRDPRGHLQATGRDARARKQYRYHPLWRQTRDATKFDRMISFGEALAAIRRRVGDDMSKRGLPRAKVVATVVHLLDSTFIRVGNEEYARDNDSFGLTTLRRKHVDVTGGVVRFAFKGKSGKQVQLEWESRRAARIIKRCQELPGQQLFQYLDEAGARRAIDSEDVNAYLREITGEAFTAKDFRTWGGTVLATCTLYGVGEFRSQRSAKRYLSAAIEVVASQLGNTPAVCRSSYVHPGVVDSYLQGRLIEEFRPRRSRAASELRPEEVAVLAFLKRLARAEKRSA